ncbi:TonB-dependent receptor plug domain-containing protein [Pseudoalteromonas luteoviolacea]|uniref:Ligand-gated channel n=1 Tax=Pseudoalteromonas luteoviolacea S4054 TaxID=1129367 RepID=A0A0F6A7L2_9GAMM|nr:TonB-dependent receptor [Pseudoalteromonas luteoviolacea]AOT07636.1 ligand-gated channel [Pseudoalteromonas luteoviolacea]AOT12552.1 ligand-gated channel [Pseudoalteromonas luteoviolacea]AOT17466.1 ligand-gated channel [Pseudoalteromonas luteoviolacea]KKE81379.1 ligand-gated channel [Pseudoalteromonas luteoviolacea S4054]KZN70612.1 ligand-gated channel [Pseudoalteromonas luteoviolacea S4047-1]
MLNTYSTIAISAMLLPCVSYAGEHHHHEKNHGDHHDHNNKHVEKIQVTASRLGRIVTESATRTEVINAEEVQEKALMRPGNISMLVAETGGVRVQNTSPALGSANIRLQGLYGRYTQLLSDGLPLYGGQSTSIGLLQIPPTDLANVEIIKGSASSLYGGSALGGVINLISRTPSDEFEGEVLFNATSKDGQDITAYVASPVTDEISTSITAGAHHQAAKDLDHDGWIDMAAYNRATMRPRLYWSNDNGANLYATFGAMTEQRTAGTLEGAVMPDGQPFVQAQDTTRLDSGFIFEQPLGEIFNLNVRGAAMHQDHEHQYGQVLENDTHESYLLETSLSGYTDDVAWLVGIAHQSDKFSSDNYPEFNYTFEVPGLFSQLDYDITHDIAMSLSARADWHSEYGTQFSPRVSVLYNPSDWTVRGSYGKGFFAPTPFIEDIDDTGLSRLAPISDLDAERATTASIDIGYTFNNVEASITLFASDVDNVTELEPLDNLSTLSGKTVRIINASGQSEIRGTELLLRYRWHDIKLTASYLYTDASKETLISFGQEPLALTPRHSAGAVIMWEEHGSHLVGFEAYYTGTQKLENNPYLDNSDPYWHLGLLGQITLGNVSWFLNAENLLNVRQTKDYALVLPQQASSGRWTTDIWSRNDGFTVNAGIRVTFG